MARYTFVSARARVEWQQNDPRTRAPHLFICKCIYNFSAQLNYHVWSPLWSFIILIFRNVFLILFYKETAVLRVLLCFTAVLCSRAADSIVTHCSVSLTVWSEVYTNNNAIRLKWRRRRNDEEDRTTFSLDFITTLMYCNQHVKYRSIC